MQPVHVADGASLMNQIAEVEIIDATMTSLAGRVVRADARPEAHSDSEAFA
jgi:hypothetical protein